MVKDTSFFGPVSSFLLYLVLATSISICGFISNSTAMIIGSMLVAPFAGPIIEWNNKPSLGSGISKGLLILLGVAICILSGYIIEDRFDFEETQEMKDRGEWDQGSPTRTMMSYIVPIISGIVVSVANDEKDIIPMVGTSIAISILPPLIAGGMYLGEKKDKENSANKAKRSIHLGLMNLVFFAISYTISNHTLFNLLKKAYHSTI